MLKQDVTCENIKKFISRYIDEKLQYKEKEAFLTHIRECPICMEQYTQTKIAHREIEKIRQQKIEQERMTEDVSAYLDGEISKSEILNFEGRLATKAKYEDELLKMMNLKRAICNTFYKQKYETEVNLSRKVIHQIINEPSIIEKMKSKFVGMFKVSFE